jgi:hypothetical protein
LEAHPVDQNIDFLERRSRVARCALLFAQGKIKHGARAPRQQRAAIELIDCTDPSARLHRSITDS